MRPQVLVPVAAASAVTGFVIGRALRFRRLMNGNLAWMSPEEKRQVRTLAGGGGRYLLKSWPRPGVNDDAKRQLLCAAAQPGTSHAEVEAARLKVLQLPQAPRRARVLTTHDDERSDDYYWIRDDARKDPDVLAYLASENAYTSAVLADTQHLQGELYTEMRGRIQEADQSVPTRDHGWHYYSRIEEGQQYSMHCRRAVPAGAGPPSETDQMDPSQPEQVLLDENRRKAEGKHDFYMTGDVQPSPDHSRLAWMEDTVGGEKFTMHVKDLSSGREVMEPIPNTSGDLMWANDNATLFYIVKDHLDRPYKVLRHRVGTPTAEDVVVYEESDEAFYVGVARSRSERMLFIHSGSAITSETRYLSADDPDGEWTVLAPRVHNTEYSVSHHPGAGGGRGGYWLITYRDETAINNELRVAPVGAWDQQQVLLPHRPDVKLVGVTTSASHLVVWERANALERAVVHALPADGAIPSALTNGTELEFDEPAYALSAGDSGEFESPVLRFVYTSLTTPRSTIDHNMATGGRAVKKVAPVLGEFSPTHYTTERLWASAPDGVKVPISLVYHKDKVQLDGSAPMLLSGYGSYEMPYDPSFKMERLVLLDRGFVFAIAHIRGGGDLGRGWYEDGKFLKKKNTFTDFIACSEHLIQHKYTSADRLCIEGRSAGGLLMGAVLNMRPDLFHAAIMGVPFVDCLTTMLDDTIPLTTIEWEEWGNPAEREFYDYMKSYSPVDNVRPQPYPHILVTAGLHDPRVGYWEPAKFVAKLRELKTDERMLLFKCEMGAGHFSVTGRFDRLKETALEHAFLLKCVGGGAADGVGNGAAAATAEPAVAAAGPTSRM